MMLLSIVRHSPKPAMLSVKTFSMAHLFNSQPVVYRNHRIHRVSIINLINQLQAKPLTKALLSSYILRQL